MFTNAQGLVISETRINDADKLLTLLTFERGKLTAKAGGVMRKGSRIAVGCQFLCFSDFTLFENRGTPRINTAEPRDMFLGLRNDPSLLALGAYIADVLNQLSDSDADCGELLRLGLNCIFALSKLGKPTELVRAAFEFRAMTLSGFMPDLSGCEFCGEEPADILFDLRRGALCCRSCRDAFSGEKGIALPCPPPVLAALRYFGEAPLSRLLSVKLDIRALPALVGITEAYMLTQLERNFRSLDFYKGFKIRL